MSKISNCPNGFMDDLQSFKEIKRFLYEKSLYASMIQHTVCHEALTLPLPHLASAN